MHCVISDVIGTLFRIATGADCLHLLFSTVFASTKEKRRSTQVPSATSHSPESWHAANQMWAGSHLDRFGSCWKVMLRIRTYLLGHSTELKHLNGFQSTAGSPASLAGDCLHMAIWLDTKRKRSVQALLHLVRQLQNCSLSSHGRWGSWASQEELYLQKLCWSSWGSVARKQKSLLINQEWKKRDMQKENEWDPFYISSLYHKTLCRRKIWKVF